MFEVNVKKHDGMEEVEEEEKEYSLGLVLSYRGIGILSA